MPVSFYEIIDVKTFLMQQHILVSEEWLEACIAFVKEEQHEKISSECLKNSVYQQWLVADLEEIACSSLPQHLPTAQKITLNKDVALQVQGIRDISKPAYSQLKQLEGSINSNAEYSSVPKASIPEWEAKPTRMLMLNLTDGCTYVQGMEYKSINFLSPNLSPGIKVLIKSPVECRLGVLLLTPENIKILGGEVESKLQKFSRENLLKAQLQLFTDENNGVDLHVDNSESIDRNQEDSMNYIERNQLLLNDNTLRDDHSITRRLQQINSSTNILDNKESNVEMSDHFGSDDDFEQNIDYEKLDEIENSQRQDEYIIPEAFEDDPDIWQEDEDIVRDMMEFQDRNPNFEMLLHSQKPFNSRNNTLQDHQSLMVFSYLSTIVNIPSSDCVITIKGFIITVLSKLECTVNKGWSLCVKINDGTASIDVNIHNKVLEDIIGVSASDMMKKQMLAAKNPEIRNEVMEAISKCKIALQNYNCLMDVKFVPGEKPCIINIIPITKLHVQQMLERVRSSFP